MKPTNIIVHHVARNHSFYQVNAYHKKLWHFKSKLGWYIGYQWFIDNSGKLYQGRREDEEGAHKIGWNKKSVGVCLRGNLESTKPTKQQLKTLEKLLNNIRMRWDIPRENVYGHRELSKTLCPGKYLMPFIKKYREKPIKETTKGRLAAQLETVRKMLLELKQKLYEYITKSRKR